MNLETKITIYKFTPQVFTLTHNLRDFMAPQKMDQRKKYPIPYLTRLQEWDIQTKQTTRPSVTDSHCI